jgi:antitoxin (DNA-binding transcriptional repressor) of toxin-antitoxin stability system
MTIMRDVRELSVAEAAKRGVAGLGAEAEQGSGLVVTRRNHPVAAVVGIARLELLEAAESDLRDLALVLARAATRPSATSAGSGRTQCRRYSRRCSS